RGLGIDLGRRGRGVCRLAKDAECSGGAARSGPFSTNAPRAGYAVPLWLSDCRTDGDRIWHPRREESALTAPPRYPRPGDLLFEFVRDTAHVHFRCERRSDGEWAVEAEFHRDETS